MAPLVLLGSTLTIGAFLFIGGTLIERKRFTVGIMCIGWAVYLMMLITQLTPRL